MKKVRFIGLDVHADSIAVAVAEPRGEVRSLGMIPNRPEPIRKLMKKLGPVGSLRVCYEAGPTGYVIYWQLTALGVACEVVAPSLVPTKAGDRVKTDRRDAEKLARSYRAGDLTAVWVPDAAHEALRDLVRAREAAKIAASTAFDAAFKSFEERADLTGRSISGGEGRPMTVDRNMCGRLLCLLVAFSCSSIAAGNAQTPATPPAKGFVLHDQRPVDRFVVQRWVSQALPDVSPSGVCECITVVYEGKRLILSLGLDDGVTNVESSGRDITGDGRAELVVTKHSGGAHCCESTAIYSVDGAPREILSVSTGNCPGELVDLDKDGVPEFKTCDDTFANTICSFAYSPMPTVVFAYDKTKGAYAVATPRYLNAAEEAKASLAEARKAMAENPRDADIRRCSALAPALSLIYGGRVDEGLALFRLVYRRPDALQLEQKAMELVRKSPLWIGR